jgi:hypothetical protein
MQFKSMTLVALAGLATSVVAHSWAECIKTEDISNVEAARANVDAPLYQKCAGYPRNKVNNGDWIAESSHYMYDLQSEGANGKACHPGQRSPVQAAGAPAATARPGETLTLRHWGNGHSMYNKGSPLHRDPGLVRVYWAGAKEMEIENVADLTSDKIIAEGNYSTNAVIALGEGTRIFEKGNYLELTLPTQMESGRHMMVWTWANSFDNFLNQWTDRYTTCFDVIIEEGSSVASPSKPAQKRPAKPAGNGAAANAKAQCAKTCYQGGMTEYPCTGENCAPCRYFSGNNINCFAYKEGTTECPFAGGYDCKQFKSA